MVKNGLFNDEQLGRLKVTTDQPFKNEHGIYHALVSYGGRSFSILRGSDLEMIYDSGNDIEQRILELLPERFNADYQDYNDIEVDGRSDDKGPEVENVVVGQVGSHSYAFVGLERVGGIMIYDITNPYEPYFVKYLYDPGNKDISPEGITFESAEESPNGKPLLIASFEVSGTTSTWELDDLLSENEGETPSDDTTDNDTSKENDDTSNIDDNHTSDVDSNQTTGDTSSKDNGKIEDMASPVKDEANQSDTITKDNAHSQKLTHHSDDMNQGTHSSRPLVEDNTQPMHHHDMKHESTQSGDTHEMKDKHVHYPMNNAKYTYHRQHELHHEHTQPMTILSHTVDAINNSTSAMHSMKHATHKDNKHVQHLPQTGQHDTTTTLWSVLVGGLGLAFLRKRKTSKIEQ